MSVFDRLNEIDRKRTAPPSALSRLDRVDSTRKPASALSALDQIDSARTPKSGLAAMREEIKLPPIAEPAIPRAAPLPVTNETPVGLRAWQPTNDQVRAASGLKQERLPVVPEQPASTDLPLPILRVASAGAALAQSAGRAATGLEKRMVRKADEIALSRGWMEPKSDTPELRNASPYERWSTWKKGIIENADQFLASDVFEEPRRRFAQELKTRSQPTGAVTDYWNHGLRSADLDMRTADAGNRFATGNIDSKQMREVLRGLKAEDSEVETIGKQLDPGKTWLGKAVRGALGSAGPMLESAAGSPVLPPLMYWQQQGAGMMIRDAIRDTDPDTLTDQQLKDIVTRTQAGGLLYAAVELVQNFIPGLKGMGLDPAGWLAKQATRKILARPAVAKITHVAVRNATQIPFEVLEEGGQQVIQDYVKDAGIPEEKRKTLQQYWDSAVEQMKQSLGPVGLISLIGGAPANIQTLREGTPEMRARAAIAEQAAPIDASTPSGKAQLREVVRQTMGDMLADKAEAAMKAGNAAEVAVYNGYLKRVIAAEDPAAEFEKTRLEDEQRQYGTPSKAEEAMRDPAKAQEIIDTILKDGSTKSLEPQPISPLPPATSKVSQPATEPTTVSPSRAEEGQILGQPAQQQDTGTPTPARSGEVRPTLQPSVPSAVQPLKPNILVPKSKRKKVPNAPVQEIRQPETAPIRAYPGGPEGVRQEGSGGQGQGDQRAETPAEVQEAGNRGLAVVAAKIGMEFGSPRWEQTAGENGAFVAQSKDGRFEAVAEPDGKLWLVNTEDGSVVSQGEVTAKNAEPALEETGRSNVPTKAEKPQIQPPRKAVGVQTGVQEQAKQTFIDTLNQQLDQTSEKGMASVFENAEFSSKAVPSASLSADISDPDTVKQWEVKIAAGDRPVILTKTQGGETTVVDGAHKLQAYKNRGFETVPTIDAKMKDSGLAEPYSRKLKAKYDAINAKKPAPSTRSLIERGRKKTELPKKQHDAMLDKADAHNRRFRELLEDIRAGRQVSDSDRQNFRLPETAEQANQWPWNENGPTPPRKPTPAHPAVGGEKGKVPDEGGARRIIEKGSAEDYEINSLAGNIHDHGVDGGTGKRKQAFRDYVERLYVMIPTSRRGKFAVDLAQVRELGGEQAMNYHLKKWIASAETAARQPELPADGARYIRVDKGDRTYFIQDGPTGGFGSKQTLRDVVLANGQSLNAPVESNEDARRFIDQYDAKRSASVAPKPGAEVAPILTPTPSGPTVSVPMGEKKADALTPQQQKKFLLAEIEKAVESAPKVLETPDVPAMADSKLLSEAKDAEDPTAAIAPLLDKYNIPTLGPQMVKELTGEKIPRAELTDGEREYKLSEAIDAVIAQQVFDAKPKVTIQVPGDGEFTIIDSKETLRAFAELADKKFPGSAPKQVSLEPKGPPKPSAIPAVRSRPILQRDFEKIAEPFTSQDDARKLLQETHLDGKTHELVATDGRRAMVITGVRGTTTEHWYLPEKAKKKEKAEFPNFAQVVPHYRAGQVPDLDNWPGEAWRKIVVKDTEKFIRQLRQAKQVLSDKLSSIDLFLGKDGELLIGANTVEFGTYTSGDLNGSTYLASLNPYFLDEAMTAMRQLGNESATVAVHDEIGPTLILGKREYVVQMPFRNEGDAEATYKITLAPKEATTVEKKQSAVQKRLAKARGTKEPAQQPPVTEAPSVQEIWKRDQKEALEKVRQTPNYAHVRDTYVDLSRLLQEDHDAPGPQQDAYKAMVDAGVSSDNAAYAMKRWNKDFAPAAAPTFNRSDIVSKILADKTLTPEEQDFADTDEGSSTATSISAQVALRREEIARLEREDQARSDMNKKAVEKKDAAIAAAPVYQQRNGWDIVQYQGDYFLRDPSTKEEVYKGKLSRVREVADESKPTPPAQPEAAPAEKPEAGSKSGEEKKPEPSDIEAGEELKYNRRNRVARRNWEDFAPLNPALKAREVQKNNVWPAPDYQAMIDSGDMGTEIPGIRRVLANIAKQARDAVAARPNVRGVPTDEDFKRYVEGVHRVEAGVSAWLKDEEGAKAWMIVNGQRAVKTLGAMNGTPTDISSFIYKGPQKTLLDFVYPDGWKAHRDELIAVGGNRLLQRLQPGYNELRRAMKDADAGWPTKREAWQVQGYRVVEAPLRIDESQHEGKTLTALYAGQDYVGLLRPEAIADARAKVAEAKPFALYLKRRYVDSFATEAEATDAAREATKREGGTQKDIQGTNVAQAERIGAERRLEGEDIDAKKLQDTFGFRGINFGNWMQGPSARAEAQAHLNHAYDAMLDLAEILNVPPKALSLDGMLGLAIGAQGSGKHAAHFVPGLNEINLTRTGGAGALAHEWAHALDHYFGTLAGFQASGSPYITEHAKDELPNVRPEIAKAFNVIVNRMRMKPISKERLAELASGRLERDTKNVNAFLSAIRSNDFRGQEAEYDVLASRVRNGDYGDGKISGPSNASFFPVVDEMRQLYRQKHGRVPPIQNYKGLQNWLDSISYRKSHADAAATHVPQTMDTDYLNTAVELDKEKKGKRYWSTRLEMFARAFDAHVADSLADKAAKNTYLAGLETAAPQGAERTAIREAFASLVGEIKTRETDKGVAMFSRVPPSPSEVRAMQERVKRGEPAFGEETVSQAEDARYLELAKDPEGNVRELQRMVDKAAFDAGYNIGPLWHGSPEKFNAFDTSAEGSHFGTEEQALSVKGKGDLKARSFFLKLKNPLRLPDLGVWNKFDNVRSYLSVNNLITDAEATEAWDAWQRSDDEGWSVLKDILGRHGFDSITYRNQSEGEGDSYIAFYPEQIKSDLPVTRSGSRVIPLSSRFNPKSPDIRFTEGRRTGAVSAERVKELTDPIVSRLNLSAEDVTIVPGVNDLPGNLAKDFSRMMHNQGFRPEDIGGAHWQGKVYIFADNLENEGDAGRVLLEEFAHRGFDILKGDDLNALFDHIYQNKLWEKRRDHARAARFVLETYKFDESTPEGRRLITNEILAHIAQNRATKPSLWTRLIQYLRNLMRKIFKGTRFEKSFRQDSTIEDVIDIALKAQRGNVGKSRLDLSAARSMADTFYSALEKRVADKKMPNRASSQQWLAIIDPAKGSGIKAEEVEWSGVKEWLGEKKLPVTREELLAFIRANRIEVKEVVKGKGEQTSMDAAYGDYKDWWINEQKGQIPLEVGDILDRWIAGDLTTANASRELAVLDDSPGGGKFAEIVAEAVPFSQGTKFASYQLPGGEAYRELLLTLPVSKPEVKGDRFVPEFSDDSWAVIDKADGSIYSTAYNEARAVAIAKEANEENANSPEQLPLAGPFYISPHWSEPNVLAHVRFNERTDADGKRVLFIEEIQSDWHQRGRETGYDGKLPPGTHLEKGLNDSWNVVNERGEVVSSWASREQALSGGVPNAPFKTSWPLLAFKRMIRYAAENGFDKIAWTTGTQQSERYDLSHQVSSIGWVRNDDGSYEVNAISQRVGMMPTQYAKDASGLSALVGKELAKRISEDQAGKGKIEGEGLKVEAKGMLAFYDQILPAEVNKYVKKWGGRVGDARVNLGKGLYGNFKEFASEFLNKPFEDATMNELATARHEWNTNHPERRGGEEPVHSLDITPSMKEAAIYEGQPMFSVLPKGPQPSDSEAEILAWIKEQKARLSGGPRAVYTAAGEGVMATKQPETFMARMEKMSERAHKQELHYKQMERQKVARTYLARIMEQRTAQAEIYKMLRETLPPQYRYKGLAMLKNAKTEQAVVRAARVLDKYIAQIQKKTLIHGIKRELQRVYASKAIAVDYVERVRELMDDVLLKRPTADTKAKLQKLQDFLEKSTAAGENVDVPRALLNKVKILKATPLALMSNEKLTAIFSEIQALAEIGKTKARVRKEIEQQIIDRTLGEIEAVTKPVMLRHQYGLAPFEQQSLNELNDKAMMDALTDAERAERERLILKLQESGPKVGETTSIFSVVKNRLRKMQNTATAFNWAKDGMDVVMDHLDGGRLTYDGPNYRTFKAAPDAQYGVAIGREYEMQEGLGDELTRLKIGEKESKRIGLYAMMVQEGGPAKLVQNNGFSEKQLDAFMVQGLTANEREAYNYMRTQMEAIKPELAEASKIMFNKPFKDVADYFTFMTDWARMQDENMNDLLVERMQRTRIDPSRSGTPEHGMLVQRKGAGVQILDLDSAKVFKRHMGAAIYLVEMGPVIKRMNRIARTDQFRESAGDLGQAIVLDYIDLLARRGGTGAQDPLAWINPIRARLSGGVMAFRVVTSLIQPTAILNAVGLLDHWAAVGAKGITDKGGLRFVYDNMPEVRLRLGDDPSFADWGEDHVLHGMRNVGYWVLTRLDRLTAAAVGMGAYRKKLKELGIEYDPETPNAEAIAYAQLMVRKTQASPFWKDQPMAVSRGRIMPGRTGSRALARAVMQFQSFSMNWFNTLLKEGLNYRKPFRAMNVWLWTMISAAAIYAIRQGWYAALDAMFGKTKYSDDDDKESLIQGISHEFVGNIPFVSGLYRWGAYGQAPVPMIETGHKVIQGTVSALTGKQPETRKKGAVRAIGSAATFVIPGASQATQIAERMVTPPKKEEPLRSRLKKLKRLKKED